jgi:hypothetical protein
MLLVILSDMPFVAEGSGRAARIARGFCGRSNRPFGPLPYRLCRQSSQPRNTNGADQKACAAVFLTLYIQNIKPDGVIVSSSVNLYFPANQSFKQKYARLGS